MKLNKSIVKRNIIRKPVTILGFSILFILLSSVDVEAQCAMCKAAAEANLKDGGLDGKGLNQGILYMLSMPYILAAVIGTIWWRNKKKIKDNLQED